MPTEGAALGPALSVSSDVGEVAEKGAHTRLFCIIVALVVLVKF